MARPIVGVARAHGINCKLALSHDCRPAKHNGGMIIEPKPSPYTNVSRQPGRRRIFVSRHPGAIEWARQHPWAVRALFVSHLDITFVVAGDLVIGTLPVHLAAKVCALGARYLHLSIDLEAGQRGSELNAEQLEAAGARLVPYLIRIESGDPTERCSRSGYQGNDPAP